MLEVLISSWSLSDLVPTVSYTAHVWSLADLLPVAAIIVFVVVKGRR